MPVKWLQLHYNSYTEIMYLFCSLTACLLYEWTTKLNIVTLTLILRLVIVSSNLSIYIMRCGCSPFACSICVSPTFSSLTLYCDVATFSRENQICFRWWHSSLFFTLFKICTDRNEIEAALEILGMKVKWIPYIDWYVFFLCGKNRQQRMPLSSPLSTIFYSWSVPKHIQQLRINNHSTSCVRKFARNPAAHPQRRHFIILLRIIGTSPATMSGQSLKCFPRRCSCPCQ